MNARVMVVVLVGCAAAPVTTPVAPPIAVEATCLADDLGPIRYEAKLDTTCEEDGRSCRRSCEHGDAMSCMLHAYALQRAESRESDAAFQRACRLGIALGCTNYAANLLFVAREQTCARRLFERACDVREPFGCGMLGRMLAFDAKTPELKAKARAYFDRTCTDLGGPICRMYALHLEQGDLGPFEPATVKALMLRACDSGDSESCGHETAGALFE